MYYCPKCHADLSADARFCNNCGFNQTNARMAALSATQRPAQPPLQPGPTQPPLQPPAPPVIPTPDTRNYTNKYTPTSNASIPQFDFDMNPLQSYPNMPESRMGNVPETPPPNANYGPQNPQSPLTLKQRYTADQPTSVQPAPGNNAEAPHPTPPPSAPSSQPIQDAVTEIIRTSTPPRYPDPRSNPLSNPNLNPNPNPGNNSLNNAASANPYNTYAATGEAYNQYNNRTNNPQAQPMMQPYEESVMTQTGEIRQILRMGFKTRTPSVVGNAPPDTTPKSILPWIIIAIIGILIFGTFALAYILFFSQTGTVSVPTQLPPAIALKVSASIQSHKAGSYYFHSAML